MTYLGLYVYTGSSSFSGFFLRMAIMASDLLHADSVNQVHQWFRL